MDLDIDHVARLACLDLSEEQRRTFRAQLQGVLDHFQSLARLDTADVSPLVHALEQPNVFRPDLPLPPLPHEAALANAPRADGGFFLVPRVVE